MKCTLFFNLLQVSFFVSIKFQLFFITCRSLSKLIYEAVLMWHYILIKIIFTAFQPILLISPPKMLNFLSRKVTNYLQVCIIPKQGNPQRVSHNTKNLTFTDRCGYIPCTLKCSGYANEISFTYAK